MCARTCARTNALGPIVANRPPGVARQARRSTIDSAIRAGEFRHAMLARARICYTIVNKQIRTVSKCVRTCLRMRKCVHVRMHWVLAWLIVNPVLHDAHFEAPSVVQPAPISATPLWQVQPFTTHESNAKHWSKCVLHVFVHVTVKTRTDALGFVMAQRIASIARQTLCGGVYRAAWTGFWRAVLACARILYKHQRRCIHMVASTFFRVCSCILQTYENTSLLHGSSSTRYCTTRIARRRSQDTHDQFAAIRDCIRKRSLPKYNAQKCTILVIWGVCLCMHNYAYAPIHSVAS